MDTYTVDKAKELIVLNNPLWNKYISLCGRFERDSNGYMYLVGENENTRIRIDDNFSDKAAEDEIEDGDIVMIEGFLNYSGVNQKTKDDRLSKAANVNLANSSFYVYLTPKRTKRVEVEGNGEETNGVQPKPDGCSSAGCCLLFVFFIIICIVVFKLNH